MVRHNNVVPNAHFHKHWQDKVKTWFNQAARKQRRRTNRIKKAEKLAPRPAAGPLRPVVRPPTQRYNMKLRYGRGFTLEELKEAGISAKYAKTVGIAVDHRRKNKSVESLQQNVPRLKAYMSKLIVFPRRPGKPKAGDSDAAACSSAEQVTGVLMPMLPEKKAEKARAITDQESKGHAYHTMRLARSEKRLKGKREKRAIEAAAAEK